MRCTSSLSACLRRMHQRLWRARASRKCAIAVYHDHCMLRPVSAASMLMASDMRSGRRRMLFGD